VHRGTQIIFSDIGTPKPDDFNIYDALKNKLTRDFAIPAHEITFIHDWKDKQKPELFKKMNQGEIRILIGSTEKAGTGLNVQKRVIGMHHMDIPWKPAELEQRDGRGARQGNTGWPSSSTLIKSGTSFMPSSNLWTITNSTCSKTSRPLSAR
jgi:superfamily II DNA/RNA helicase